MGFDDVLFVHSRLCARTAKQARALDAQGVRVHLLELAHPSPFYDYSAFASHTHLDRPHDVRSLLRHGRAARKAIVARVRKIRHDLVHTHNAPDCIAPWAAAGTQRPVIHDIHDAQTIIPTLYSNALGNRVIDAIKARWERQAVKKTDSLVVPSPRMAEHFARKYGRPVHSFENKVEPIEFQHQPKLSDTDGGIHISYAGGISFSPGAARNLWPVFERIAIDDVHMHIYSINFDDRDQERLKALCADATNIHYHEPLGGPAYFDAMSKYDYGLIWFTRFDKNLAFATANRMYELPVVGCPIITNMREGYIGDWVSGGRRGIVADNVAQVHDELRNPPEFDLDPADCFMNGADLLRIYSEVASA